MSSSSYYCYYHRVPLVLQGIHVTAGHMFSPFPDGRQWKIGAGPGTSKVQGLKAILKP